MIVSPSDPRIAEFTEDIGRGSGTVFCHRCGTGFEGDGRLIAISEHLDTHDLRSDTCRDCGVAYESRAGGEACMGATRREREGRHDWSRP
jgi:hypothetical protein